MEFKHYSVMACEAINGLNVNPEGIYVDCTLGGAGHTKLILQRLTSGGRVIGIDRDSEAIDFVKQTVTDERLLLYHDNFENIAQAVDFYGYKAIDGVLIDLGVSSYQLDNAERGFSYTKEAPLDMRMNRADKLTAYEVVNGYQQSELERIFYEYGEEKFSRRIAEKIIVRREQNPIQTTTALAEIIASAIPKSVKFDGHPAKRCFQAIRIEVNSELEVIAKTIKSAIELLKSGGRIVVISFHSLEDRIVKTTFQGLVLPCTCPKDFPCVCGKTPVIKTVSKKVIQPSERENNENSRSHSAKLRIAEKI
ncbi:MAG: 16S rRNA (cytosine(1402)-N(4))-methyltransferase RsmH [Clostridia bacterium]